MGLLLVSLFNNVKDALFLSVNEFQQNDLKLIIRANIRLRTNVVHCFFPTENSKTLAQIMKDKYKKI
jgi:hypothetical protein